MTTSLAGPCPSPDDPHYVSVQGVSEGLFTAINQFWQSAAGTADTLRTALANVPPEDMVGNKTNPDDRVWQANLNSFLRDATSSTPLHMTNIRFEPDGNFAGYAIILSNGQEGSDYELIVEISEHGLIVTHFFKLVSI